MHVRDHRPDVAERVGLRTLLCVVKKALEAAREALVVSLTAQEKVEVAGSRPTPRGSEMLLMRSLARVDSVGGYARNDSINRSEARQ